MRISEVSEQSGLPLEVLIEYYQLVQQGDETVEARKQILLDQREQLVVRLEEIQKTLDIVDHKIEVYADIILKKENEIAQVED